MAYKFRIVVVERERGWGEDAWFEHLDTEQEARDRIIYINSQNKPGPAPDYYIQAESGVERVWVDDTPDTGYKGKHRATEAVNEVFNR